MPSECQIRLSVESTANSLHNIDMTDEQIVDDVVRRFKQLKKERQYYEDTWEKIARFVAPKRFNFELNEGQTGARPLNAYNGTAIEAMELMVNGLLGYLVSRVTKWIKLYHEDQRMMQYSEVRQYLQDVEEQLYSEFNKSNFYDVMPSIFKDGASFGTACVHVDEDIINQRVSFTARHPKETYIAEDKYGYVDTVIRNYFMTTKQIIESFRKDKGGDKEGNKLPEDWIEQNKENMYKKHKVIHAVFPRRDRDVTKVDNKNKPYAVVYLLEDSNILLRESGLDSMCDVVWRWETNTDETYGRSPAWTALSDIERLNKVSKDLLELSDYAVNPAIQHPARIGYRLSLKPGARNPYESPDEMIRPIDKGGNYPIGRDREEVIEQAIRAAFHTDFFLGLQQVTKTMTIPEVMERQGEKAAVLGTAVGRINSELLDPLIDKTFEIAQRAGRMPEVPPVLADGGDMRIEYVGPLAQILKRNFSTQGITRSMEQVLPYAQLNPEILDNINWDEMVGQLMIGNGMPQKAIRSKDEVAAIRQQRAQAQAQAAQAQQMNEFAKNIPNLNTAPEDGTILADLNNQLAGAVNGQPS